MARRWGPEYLKSGLSLAGRDQVFGCKIRPGIENLLKNNTQITILFFGLFGFSQIHKIMDFIKNFSILQKRILFS